MKNLKSYMIAGIIFVSIVGTIFHFVYHLSGNNYFIGLFVPVNESIWEHIKLLFFPMLIFSLYTNKKLSTQYPCIKSAMFFGIIVGAILIPTLFYTYSGILGFNVAIVDISIFYISVLTAFYVCYRTTCSCKANKYEPLLKSLILIIAVLFVVFTISPPGLPLFAEPQ